MQLHVFGATTPTGEAFRHCAAVSEPSWSLYAYSRRSASHPADFHAPAAFRPAGEVGEPAIWISFGPIWLFAPFLDRLALESPECLQGVLCVIACSSSSAITKRFAANRFDRELVVRLNTAEDQLIAACKRLKLTCRIFRPTLIYGREGPYVDRNLSRIIKLMRWLPLLPVPAQTGLRQPIHATQLALVALQSVRQFVSGGWNHQLSECIALGGDTELSYVAMLRSLQQALPDKDPARRCCLLSLPNRFYYAAAAPLLLQSPKAFEAVLRMSSNLSGFMPAHQLLNAEPQPFPVLPLI
jgi:hypothetical protein